MASRPAQKKADQNLARMVVGRYHSAAWARKAREKVWWDARKRYDPSRVDKTKVKSEPFIKTPYVFRVTNNGVSEYIAAARSNGQFAVARSTTPEHGATGEIVTNVLQRQFMWQGPDVHKSNPRNLKLFAQSGELYGNGFAHVSWFDHPTDWGCRVRNIDPMDVFPDWKEYRWVTIRRRVTVAELGDIARVLSGPKNTVLGIDEETGEPILDTEPRDGGRALRAFKRVEREAKKGHRNYHDNFSGIHDEPLDKPIDLGRVDDNYETEDEGSVEDVSLVRVEVLEYHETRADGIVAKVIPGFGDGGEDLVFEKGVNAYGVCTIVPFTPNPIDNEIWGYGVSEIVGANEEVMSHGTRAGVRLINKTVDAPLLYRRNLRLRPSFLARPAGQAQEVDDITTALGYMPTGVDNGAYPFLVQWMRDNADLGTGSSESQRGQASGAKSATGDAIAEKGGQTNTSLKMDEWARSLAQVARVMLEMLKVHITTEKAIPLAGRNADRLVALKPEYLKGTFEVTFGGSLTGMNRQEEITGIVNYLQTLAPTGIANVPYLARELARKLGAADPDQWVVAGANEPKVSANSENSMVFEFGMEPEVHPEDDDIQHMVSHQKFAQRIAAENPSHPGIAIMAEHFAGHQTALAAKQQQMAMAGGIGGGSPQALTAPNAAGQMQGGENGQSANVDAMRQQPNIAAAGQAPGGATVPNRPVGGLALGGPR
jgi:hypothetical protein